MLADGGRDRSSREEAPFMVQEVELVLPAKPRGKNLGGESLGRVWPRSWAAGWEGLASIPTARA